MNYYFNTSLLMYFTVGWLVLYALWYFAFWSWARPSNVTLADFWLREFEFNDSRDRGESHWKRSVRFGRTLVVLLTFSSLIAGALFAPGLNSEIRFVLMSLAACVCPWLAWWFTYKGKREFRFIPVLWGWLIGGVALTIFASKALPWNMSPSENLKSLVGENWPQSLLVSALFGSIVPGLFILERFMNKKKRYQWLAWCGVAMFFGSSWAFFGLVWSGLLRWK